MRVALRRLEYFVAVVDEGVLHCCGPTAPCRPGPDGLAAVAVESLFGYRGVDGARGSRDLGFQVARTPLCVPPPGLRSGRRYREDVDRPAAHRIRSVTL
jgi:hypothetical protein